MQSPDSKPVMPDNDEAQPADDGLVDAVVQHIKDDIEDHRSLREGRFALACGLLFVAGVFYIAFFYVLYLGILNMEQVRNAQTVSIVVILTLIIVPTLLLLIVARAVFGIKKTSGSVPSSPIEALLHLMKEMKGQ